MVSVFLFGHRKCDLLALENGPNHTTQHNSRNLCFECTHISRCPCLCCHAISHCIGLSANDFQFLLSTAMQKSSKILDNEDSKFSNAVELGTLDYWISWIWNRYIEYTKFLEFLTYEKISLWSSESADVPRHLGKRCSLSLVFAQYIAPLRWLVSCHISWFVPIWEDNLDFYVDLVG